MSPVAAARASPHHLRVCADPHSPLVPVNDHTEDGGPFDPCHSFDCITRQVYGFDKPANETALPTMKGFVQDAVRHGCVPRAVVVTGSP